MNPAFSVTVALPSLLFTVTFRAPVPAFAVMVTLTVSEVAELNVVEFTVIPEPENDTAAPDKKFVPVIVKFWFDAP